MIGCLSVVCNKKGYLCDTQNDRFTWKKATKKINTYHYVMNGLYDSPSKVCIRLFRELLHKSFLVIPCLFWLVNISDQSFITPENYLPDKKNAITRDGKGCKWMSLDRLLSFFLSFTLYKDSNWVAFT